MKARGKFLFFIDKTGARLYPIKGVWPNINFDDIDVEVEVKEMLVEVKSFRKVLKRHFGYDEGGCTCDACVARKKAIEAILDDLYNMVEALKKKVRLETTDRGIDTKTGKMIEGRPYIKYDKEAEVFNSALDEVLELASNP